MGKHYSTLKIIKLTGKIFGMEGSNKMNTGRMRLEAY